MRDFCETADVLRRGADRLRDIATLSQPGDCLSRPWDLAVADWLAASAEGAQEVFESTQRPSAGVDQPPAVAYGDPAKAERLAAGHYHHALTSARKILGIEPIDVIEIKGDLL